MKRELIELFVAGVSDDQRSRAMSEIVALAPDGTVDQLDDGTLRCRELRLGFGRPWQLLIKPYRRPIRDSQELGDFVATVAGDLGAICFEPTALDAAIANEARQQPELAVVELSKEGWGESLRDWVAHTLANRPHMCPRVWGVPGEVIELIERHCLVM
jgi:hypothetical protein